jgi:hypothetical protein
MTDDSGVEGPVAGKVFSDPVLRFRNCSSGVDTFQLFAGGVPIASVGFVMKLGMDLSPSIPTALIALGLALTAFGAWTAYRPRQIVIDARRHVVIARELIRERTISFHQIQSIEIRPRQSSGDDHSVIFDIALLVGDGTRVTHSVRELSTARKDANQLADILQLPLNGEREV